MKTGQVAIVGVVVVAGGLWGRVALREQSFRSDVQAAIKVGNDVDAAGAGKRIEASASSRRYQVKALEVRFEDFMNGCRNSAKVDYSRPRAFGGRKTVHYEHSLFQLADSVTTLNCRTSTYAR